MWAFARPGHARPRLIHRLDRDTSGVILTAKTKPAAAALGKAMMGRQMTKTYLAVVAPGPPDPPAGAIEAALRREEIGREAYMRVCPPDHPDAESAHTLYRTLAAGKGAALVELSPRTGRMHQLRVHLASIGRPIAGDARYGGALTLGGRPVPRLMLHAAALEFPHPEGGRRRIEAPLPADFVAALAAAGIESRRGRKARITPAPRAGARAEGRVGAQRRAGARVGLAVGEAGGGEGLGQGGHGPQSAPGGGEGDKSGVIPLNRHHQSSCQSPSWVGADRAGRGWRTARALRNEIRSMARDCRPFGAEFDF